eukprot:GDKK01017807.1.p1 GENE.GDKK01017807.1~~GDKK01017807.1.p1  ORF type:complete len:1412 (+),score=308.36 GDKK01017807.1:1-4236(+)
MGPLVTCSRDFDLFADAVTRTADILKGSFSVSVIDETQSREIVTISRTARAFVMGDCPGDICATVDIGRTTISILSRDATGKSQSCNIIVRVFPPVSDSSDVDECALGLHRCPSPSSACVDKLFSQNPNGYDCTCTSAYLTYDASTFSCVKLTPPLAAVNECTARTHGCHRFATCTDASYGYDCQCTSSYEGDGLTCVASSTIALAELLPLNSFLGIADVQTQAKMGRALSLSLLGKRNLLLPTDFASLSTRLMRSMSISMEFAAKIDSGNTTQRVALSEVSTSQISIVKRLLVVTEAQFLSDLQSGAVMSDFINNLNKSLFSTVLSTASGLLNLVKLSASAETLSELVSSTSSALDIFGTLLQSSIVTLISPDIQESETSSGGDPNLLNSISHDALQVRQTLSNSLTNAMALFGIARGISNPSTFDIVRNVEGGVIMGVSRVSEEGSTQIAIHNWNTTIPKIQNSSFSDCAYKFGVFALWPSNFYSPAAVISNTPDSMFSLSLFASGCQGSTLTDMLKIEEISVSGLNKKAPILIKMAIDTQNSEYFEKALCGFYDTENFKNDYNGCLRDRKLDNVENGYIHCECTHLTDFGALLKDVVMSTNLALLGRIGQLIFDVRNFGFWIILAFTIAAFLVMARAIYRDVKYPITNESLLLVYCNDRLIIEKLREQDQEEESAIDEYKKTARIIIGKDDKEDVSDTVKAFQVARIVNDKSNSNDIEDDSDAENTRAEDKTQRFKRQLNTLLQQSRDQSHSKMASAATKIARAWRRRSQHQRNRAALVPVASRPLEADHDLDRWKFPELSTVPKNQQNEQSKTKRLSSSFSLYSYSSSSDDMREDSSDDESDHPALLPNIQKQSSAQMVEALHLSLNKESTSNEISQIENPYNQNRKSLSPKRKISNFDISTTQNENRSIVKTKTSVDSTASISGISYNPKPTRISPSHYLMTEKSRFISLFPPTLPNQISNDPASESSSKIESPARNHLSEIEVIHETQHNIDNINNNVSGASTQLKKQKNVNKILDEDDDEKAFDAFSVVDDAISIDSFTSDKLDQDRQKSEAKKNKTIQKALNQTDLSVEAVSSKMQFVSWSPIKLFYQTLIREHPIAGQEIGFRRSSVQLALKYGSALLGALFLVACFFGVDETPMPPEVEGHKYDVEVQPDVPLIVIPMPFDMSFMGPFQFTGINITLKGLLTSILSWILGQMIPFIVDLLFNVQTPYIKRLEPDRHSLQFSINPKTGLIPVTLMNEQEQISFIKKLTTKVRIGMVLGSLYSLFCLFFLFVFVLALGAGFENDERWRQTSDFFFTTLTMNVTQLVLWPLAMAFLFTLLIKLVLVRTRKLDRLVKLRPQWVQYSDPSVTARDCRVAQRENLNLTDVVEGSDAFAFALVVDESRDTNAKENKKSETLNDKKSDE